VSSGLHRADRGLLIVCFSLCAPVYHDRQIRRRSTEKPAIAAVRFTCLHPPQHVLNPTLFHRSQAMRTSKTISVRLPVIEAESIEAAAREAGLSLNSYARSMLNRERVDNTVALSLLHKQIESQREEIGSDLSELRREIEGLRDMLKSYNSLSTQIIAKLSQRQGG
jgi:predicted ribosome quality control (RQC) complex YloA/Tae2 family protein